MKKIITVIMSFVIAGTLLLAVEPGCDQDRGPNRGQNEKTSYRHEFDNEEFYEYMIFQMTRTLDLTPEQAEKFFPLYNQQMKKQKAMHDEYKNIMKDASELKKVNKKDLEKFQENVKAHRMNEVVQKMEFFDEVENILSPEQTLRYMFFEERFRRDLVDELQNRHKKNK